jgi:dihydrofolate reductase
MSKPPQVFPALDLVVAVADNGVIGREQDLPWRQRADLRHFKALTLGHPVLMGRRTWESIGRPLPGRLNLVLTGQRGLVLPGATVVDSLDSAVRAVGEAPTLFVIGGATLYELTLPMASVLHLTEVHAEPEGDVCFPIWDRNEWIEAERADYPADGENDHPYSFVTYRRRR